MSTGPSALLRSNQQGPKPVGRTAGTPVTASSEPTCCQLPFKLPASDPEGAVSLPTSLSQFCPSCFPSATASTSHLPLKVKPEGRPIHAQQVLQPASSLTPSHALCRECRGLCALPPPPASVLRSCCCLHILKSPLVFCHKFLPSTDLFSHRPVAGITCNQ